MDSQQRPAAWRVHFFVGAAKWNVQILEGFGMLADEWQNFVSRRVAED
jgi:hypothetical protein